MPGANSREAQLRRRRAFAEHIIGGMTAVAAAAAAGFTGARRTLEVTGSKLLQEPLVRELIAAAEAKLSKKRILTAERRREILAEIAEGEMVQEIVTEGGEGVTVTRRRPSAGERKAAIEHLDRLDGLVVERAKVDHHHRGRVDHLVAQIPEDRLRARLAELAEHRAAKTNNPPRKP